MERGKDNRSTESLATVISSPAPSKKFEYYTTQFHDEVEYGEPDKKLTISMRFRHEAEIYLQMKLLNTTTSDNDHLLLFWKEQQYSLPTS
jgi:hypothetical protein